MACDPQELCGRSSLEFPLNLYCTGTVQGFPRQSPHNAPQP